MSLYRTFGKVPTNDVYADKVKRAEEPRPAAPPSPVIDTSRPQEATQYKRKGEPVNVVLPRTREWAESLPQDLRPTALLRAFPRVANMIAAAWTDSAATSTYMDELLVDCRGRRQGFPADVMDELVALRTYYAGLHPESPTAWKYTNKRG